jgi:hypothetical protein
VELISKKTQELSLNLSKKLRRLREIFPVSIKLKLPLKDSLTVLISPRALPELDSRNFAKIFSKRLFNQFNKFLMTQV